MDITEAQKNFSRATNILDDIEDTLFGKDEPDDLIDTIIDKDWVSGMFLIKDSDLKDKDSHYRYYSTAHMKFVDTSMGGNLGVNSRPQFTRYADIRVPGRVLNRNKVTVNSKEGNHGLGIYYSEAIDDNAQTLFMQFGVPGFNSLYTYFTRAIDYKTAVLANTGRSPFMYNLGNTIGTIAMFVAFPAVSIAVFALKYLTNALLGPGTFDYYYLNKTMHMYWDTVNSIVTMMAIELGIVSSIVMDNKNSSNTLGIPLKLSKEDMDVLKEAAPDIFTEDNYIDVFAIVNKAQIIANEQHDNLQKLQEAGYDTESFVNYLGTKYDKKMFKGGFKDWVKEVLQLGELFGGKAEEKDISGLINSVTNNTDTKETKNKDGTITIKNKKELSWFGQYKKYLEAELKGGGQFAIFKIDYLGSVTETFSNSIKEIPTEGMIKSVTGKGRDVRFTFAGGKLTDGLDTIVNAATDVLHGVLNSATFGLSNVIGTMLGNAYLDIPKMYDDSTMSFPKNTYSMTLISPTPHPISMLQNIMIPLAMVLAGGLPLSTGKASYTSPFLCNTFIRGIERTTLGIITDISINRGVSNLGFSKDSKALAIEVTWSVAVLNEGIAAPINKDIGSIFSSTFDASNSISTYLSIICARDLKTTYYNIEKAKIRFSNKKFGLDKISSPSYWASSTSEIINTVIGGVLDDYKLALNYK